MTAPTTTKYGLITETDAKTLEKTLDLVKQWFKKIWTLEIGVHAGKTTYGILNYLEGENHLHTGIDNNKDGMTDRLMDIKHNIVYGNNLNFILGNSNEVYNKIPDNSQSLIFIDANHSYGSTMLDFLLYSDKVAPNGYIAFHDTGKHIKPFTDYQGMGSKDDPDMYISCRKAIKKLGLLDNHPNWLLVFDEADENFATGGMTVLKKI